MRKSPAILLSVLSLFGVACFVEACGEDSVVGDSPDAAKEAGNGADSAPVGDDDTPMDDASVESDAQENDAAESDAAIADGAVGDGAIDASVDAAPADSGVCNQIPGLVAWWKGDGDTGNEMGPLGLWNGSGGYGTGKVGLGWSFDGIGSNFVETPDSDVLDLTTGFTVEAWVNVGAASLSGRIADKITSGGSDGWLLDIVNGKLRAIAGGYVATATTTLTTGSLVHVAATWAPGAPPVLYVDGAEVTTTTAGSSGPIATTLAVRVGADQTGNNRFKGVIDELGIYSRALSAAEIAEQFATGDVGRCVHRYEISGTLSGLVGQVVISNNGYSDIGIFGNGSFKFSKKMPSGGTYDIKVKTPPATQYCAIANGSGTIGTAPVTNVTVTCTKSYVQTILDAMPVAYWPFNDQSSAANTLKDVVGGLQGSISGGVTTNVGGLVKTGKAVSFNGTSGYIDIPFATALNGSGDFSVEAWASVATGAGNGPAQPWAIVSSRDAFKGYMLYFVPSTNGSYIQWGDGAAWTATTYSGMNTVPRPTAHHFVMAYTAATKTGVLYIDGAAYANVPSANALSPNTVRAFRIGAGANEGAANFFFNGVVDDVAYYSRAMGLAEAISHYNTGIAEQ